MYDLRLPLPGALGACLLAAFAASTAAQTNPVPQTEFTLAIDSGRAANAGSTPATVLSFHVSVEGAPWMRLYFSDVQLAGNAERGTGSVLKITSLLDGYYQVLDARSLEQWNDSSAYFNGDLLLVEVIAHPGTGMNRVVVERADVGLIPSGGRTICDSSDERQFSNDPRAARLLPIGCTGWILNDACGCFGTAGHCTTGSNVVQFNVPLSNANGSINNPPPQDQYSVDTSSRQFTNGGVGNDWGYFGAFPNSNTGLTPRQAQGAAFTVSAPPGFNASQKIRITGYGTDSGTANQAQQTDDGPWFSFSGTTMRYRTDTTGGNSGSPVIHEPTGNAVGIHTHGGCGSSSGSSNAGTGANHPGFVSALANPQGVCIALTCAFTPSAQVRNGSGINPLCFNSLSSPAIGTTWMAEVDTSGVPGADLTIVQIRRRSSPGTPASFGELLIDLSSPLIASSEALAVGGASFHAFPIPANVVLGGVVVHAQSGIVANGGIQTLCNAIDVHIGCAP